MEEWTAIERWRGVIGDPSAPERPQPELGGDWQSLWEDFAERWLWLPPSLRIQGPAAPTFMTAPLDTLWAAPLPWLNPPWQPSPDASEEGTPTQMAPTPGTASPLLQRPRAPALSAAPAPAREDDGAPQAVIPPPPTDPVPLPRQPSAPPRRRRPSIFQPPPALAPPAPPVGPDPAQAGPLGQGAPPSPPLLQTDGEAPNTDRLDRAPTAPPHLRRTSLRWRRRDALIPSHPTSASKPIATAIPQGPGDQGPPPAATGPQPGISLPRGAAPPKGDVDGARATQAPGLPPRPPLPPGGLASASRALASQHPPPSSPPAPGPHALGQSAPTPRASAPGAEGAQGRPRPFTRAWVEPLLPSLLPFFASTLGRAAPVPDASPAPMSPEDPSLLTAPSPAAPLEPAPSARPPALRRPPLNLKPSASPAAPRRGIGPSGPQDPDVAPRTSPPQAAPGGAMPRAPKGPPPSPALSPLPSGSPQGDAPPKGAQPTPRRPGQSRWRTRLRPPTSAPGGLLSLPFPGVLTQGSVAFLGRLTDGAPVTVGAERTRSRRAAPHTAPGLPPLPAGDPSGPRSAAGAQAKGDIPPTHPLLQRPPQGPGADPQAPAPGRRVRGRTPRWVYPEAGEPTPSSSLPPSPSDPEPGPDAPHDAPPEARRRTERAPRWGYAPPAETQSPPAPAQGAHTLPLDAPRGDASPPLPQPLLSAHARPQPGPDGRPRPPVADAPIASPPAPARPTPARPGPERPAAERTPPAPLSAEPPPRRRPRTRPSRWIYAQPPAEAALSPALPPALLPEAPQGDAPPLPGTLPRPVHPKGANPLQEPEARGAASLPGHPPQPLLRSQAGQSPPSIRASGDPPSPGPQGPIGSTPGAPPRGPRHPGSPPRRRSWGAPRGPGPGRGILGSWSPGLDVSLYGAAQGAGSTGGGGSLPPQPLITLLRRDLATLLPGLGWMAGSQGDASPEALPWDPRALLPKDDGSALLRLLMSAASGGAGVGGTSSQGAPPKGAHGRAALPSTAPQGGAGTGPWAQSPERDRDQALPLLARGPSQGSEAQDRPQGLPPRQGRAAMGALMKELRARRPMMPSIAPTPSRGPSPQGRSARTPVEAPPRSDAPWAPPAEGGEAREMGRGAATEEPLPSFIEELAEELRWRLDLNARWEAERL